jgi:hypothetical protein
MIDTAQQSILTKMGFAQVMKFENISLTLEQEIKLEGLLKKKKLPKLASLPDIYDESVKEMPEMYLKSQVKNADIVQIKLVISDFGITC